MGNRDSGTRGTIRIGISGWRYKPWRGTFYPKELPQKAELEYASSLLPVIEINGSFYSLQRPESYARWYAETPDNFVFAVKGGRYITHMRRLKDVQAPLANFLASGVFCLREKLGPILWQFPPNFRYDHGRMAAFLDLLPRDTQAALALARRHDSRIKGRTFLSIDDNRAMRHAVEIRNETFMDSAFVDLLRDHNVALVIAETAQKWPMLHDITADFLYMRLHGDTEIYRSAYSDEALDKWARRIAAWRRGGEPRDAQKVSQKPPPSDQPKDVYCFFDNTDVKLRAPFDAQTLARKLRVKWNPVSTEAPTPSTRASVRGASPSREAERREQRRQR